jgi:hypothetical protein
MDFFKKKINQITSHLNQILLCGVHAVFFLTISYFV